MTVLHAPAYHKMCYEARCCNTYNTPSLHVRSTPQEIRGHRNTAASRRRKIVQSINRLPCHCNHLLALLMLKISALLLGLCFSYP
ncbi:uncharacterized protein EKO05_0007119 [Ascochyta rabiei]|uniref:uncharacterized protein n=1 Tax=Didymella rabiei TaxID=5454 RepID=UPI0022031E69|nr:uncharacterized protein EKO05_0007119 [Ascochyta rabiei]UPX16732.1 hypothetical protein EKO05_0007119 [Ascochyta rabiei]